VGSVQSCEWSVGEPLSKVIAKGMPNTSVVWSGDTANVVYPWRSAAVTDVFTCGTWPTTETVPDLPNAFTVVPSRK
jgi:hypothetical protein